MNITTPVKALFSLGLAPMFILARYRFGLVSGLITNRVARECGQAAAAKTGRFRPLLWLPSREAVQTVLGQVGQAQLMVEAEEIISGRVRLFGGEPQPLHLTPQPPLRPWSFYERGDEDGQDIKFTWEPARFGWAFTLGRAYLVSGDERCSQAFWDSFDIFLQANPPGQGPNWTSAQETALRLLAFVFAAQAFAASPRATQPRMARLLQAIAVHAARIPATLDYGRAQNNNHLLSEAAGLYTAGVALPYHPSARRWRRLGWRWFHAGLQRQIDADGAYSQHSTNYQRLMLQLALWMAAVAESAGDRFPEKSIERLAAATRWLLALQDPISGGVPNLGPNDGANLLPLAAAPLADFRPVLAGAARRFLSSQPYKAGPWDELGMWLTGKPRPTTTPLSGKVAPSVLPPTGNAGEAQPLAAESAQGLPIIRLPGARSWAYLRAIHYKTRPHHSDQLHLDLWWRGLNIAKDAGSYLYNAPPPWDNALSGARVHNTVTIAGTDSMTRAGRFLWLDWAQAEIVEQTRQMEDGIAVTVARHTGYRRYGILHQRRASLQRGDLWEIVDEILPTRPNVRALSACLHWLLPDWDWELREQQADRVELRLHSPFGQVGLEIVVQAGVWAAQAPLTQAGGQAESPGMQLALIRAGEELSGETPAAAILGWFSPTYSVKCPALSCVLTACAAPPFTFITRFKFP